MRIVATEADVDFFKTVTFVRALAGEKKAP